MIPVRHRPFLAGAVVALAAGWFVLPHLFYKSVAQPLHFSHQTHVGETVGMACSDCHSFTEEGTFTGIPPTTQCADCHAAAIGESPAESTLVDAYITPGREIPWLVYSRQPDNVYFSHIQHVNRAQLECSQCHGDQGTASELRPYRVNRISGYSRDVSARRIAGLGGGPAHGLSMDDCMDCHRSKGAPNSCLTCHK